MFNIIFCTSTFGFQVSISSVPNTKIVGSRFDTQGFYDADDVYYRLLPRYYGEGFDDSTYVFVGTIYVVRCEIML